MPKLKYVKALFYQNMFDWLIDRKT